MIILIPQRRSDAHPTPIHIILFLILPLMEQTSSPSSLVNQTRSLPLMQRKDFLPHAREIITWIHDHPLHAPAFKQMSSAEILFIFLSGYPHIREYEDPYEDDMLSEQVGQNGCDHVFQRGTRMMGRCSCVVVAPESGRKKCRFHNHPIFSSEVYEYLENLKKMVDFSSFLPSSEEILKWIKDHSRHAKKYRNFYSRKWEAVFAFLSRMPFCDYENEREICMELPLANSGGGCRYKFKSSTLMGGQCSCELAPKSMNRCKFHDHPIFSDAIEKYLSKLHEDINAPTSPSTGVYVIPEYKPSVVADNRDFPESCVSEYPDCYNCYDADDIIYK